MTSNNRALLMAAAVITLQCGVIFGAAWAKPRHSVGHHAVSEPMQITKTVPEGATLELRVNGQVAQSIDVRPGTYKIIVEQLR